MRVLIWHWCHGPCARLALLWSRRAVWLKLLLELEVDSFPNCVFRICCRVLIYGIEHLFFLYEMTKGGVQCPPGTGPLTAGVIESEWSTERYSARLTLRLVHFLDDERLLL